MFTDKEDRETYLVVPAMRAALVGEARPVLLVPAITQGRAVHLARVRSPARMAGAIPGRDGAGGDEHRKESWVRLMPDMSLGAYRIYQREGQLSDPVWPDKSFEELLEIAFRTCDRRQDHPVVRRLRGLV